MAGFLQKLLSSAGGKSNLPVLRQGGVPVPPGQAPPPRSLPNASIVYSIAASVLFVVAVYSLLSGSWINALLVLLVAACLMGYALHFLKHG